MDYTSFKDYLVTFLWKTGDALLINNLDSLIKQGEASLNRELREEQRHAALEIALTDNTMTLPADYYSMRLVGQTGGELGDFTYATPTAIRTYRERDAGILRPVYSILDNSLMFTAPSTTVAVDEADYVTIDYVRKIGGYAADDASWLTEDNLDLLVYAVLYHTAPFLREDERVQLWQGMYKDIINTMNEQSAHEKQRGVYGAMPLPRQASGYVRKGTRSVNSYKLNSRP